MTVGAFEHDVTTASDPGSAGSVPSSIPAPTCRRPDLNISARFAAVPFHHSRAADAVRLTE